jgi:hypothetical protein
MMWNSEEYENRSDESNLLAESTLDARFFLINERSKKMRVVGGDKISSDGEVKHRNQLENSRLSTQSSLISFGLSR